LDLNSPEILELVNSQPKTPEEIAHEHFEPQVLEGFGFKLAINELLTHCELMEFSGNIAWTEGNLIIWKQSERYNHTGYWFTTHSSWVTTLIPKRHLTN